ncbi:MAG: hypothetical protein Q4A78_12280 [Peptostreptococcaceae bacterium]|nr:hypothetical protein [Peptostreptococcaceae bacterium]
MKEMKKVITIEELKKRSTEVVEIEDFAGTGTIAVELKRPSVLEVARSGEIPNELMGLLKDLFVGKGVEEALSKNEDISRLREVFLPIAKAALVSPSYREIEEAGITLTDMQLQEIYSFATGGVKELENFRKIQVLYQDFVIKSAQQAVSQLDLKAKK